MRNQENSALVLGNTAFRNGRYEEALGHYAKVFQASPELRQAISSNICIARNRYRRQAKERERMRVAVSGWDLSHNAAGRAYTLARLYQEFSEVEIIGFILPGRGQEIWEPLRDSTINIKPIRVENEGRIFDSLLRFLWEQPYDIVHLSKPRAPNIFLGILYKWIWGAEVLVDIDDEELAFVNEDKAISLDEYLEQHKGLPSLNNLTGKAWTRLSVGMAKAFDGVTVSNPALRQRYGGTMIRHARDEKVFIPSSELKARTRARFDIPMDKTVILFCGTPREHKGILEAAKAIAQLKRDDIIFLIVGNFPEQDLKRKLLEVPNCDIRFLENQPFGTLHEIVAMGDICLLLQDESTQAARFQVPAKLTDALAMGLVTMANPLPSLQDLMESGAILSLKGHIPTRIALVMNHPDLAARAMTAGIKLFKDELSVEVNARRLRDFLSTRTSSRLSDAGDLLCKAYLGHGEARRGDAAPSDSAVAHVRVKEASIADPDVDIIVPVFNALQSVQDCLESLLRCRDGVRLRVILINDHSDDRTTDWLRGYCEDKAEILLVEQKRNVGYTRSVNLGLMESMAPYVVTLNSDTIVTKGWLKGLFECIESDPKIGIVGPLSNAASWQNVPHLYNDRNEFAINALPLGMTPDVMAGLVAETSSRKYPRTPFLNGFCFMISREVIDAIGCLDEDNFPLGYGEENDYCIRAANAGFDLAIADNVYVFHSKSKSFGHERRKELSKLGSDNLKAKHTAERVDSLVGQLKRNAVLDEIRSGLRQQFDQRTGCQPATGQGMMDMRILFLLPVRSGGGGVHSIVQEVGEMRRLGLAAQIAVYKEYIGNYLSNYEDVDHVRDIFVGFDDRGLLTLAKQYDVIVGTIYSSMKLVKTLVAKIPKIMPAYYVQDYEPMFFEHGSPNWKEAHDSYRLIPGACLFAKTQWLVDIVRKEHDVTVARVSPSIDHGVFRPIARLSDGRIRLAAMIRPSTPRRGPDRTMRILARLQKSLAGKVHVSIFGCSDDDEQFKALARDFSYTNHGVLKRREVADLLGNTDVFLDLSDYQAFGRTALESMACGATAVVPGQGGTDEYAIHDVNCIVVDTRNEEECYAAIHAVLLEPERIGRMQSASLLTASRYSLRQAAISECLAIHDALIGRGRHADAGPGPGVTQPRPEGSGADGARTP